MPSWPRYDTERDELLEFAASGPVVQHGFRREQLDWNDMYVLPVQLATAPAAPATTPRGDASE